MLLANGPTSEHGIKYEAFHEYLNMKTLGTKVKPFGFAEAKDRLEGMARSFFVDQAADLVEVRALYIIIGAKLVVADGVKKIVDMEWKMWCIPWTR